jgi:Holliday junction resolvasome RuvABC endonuclease subunit
MNQTSKQSRVLAVSFSTFGFGYAVMENEKTLVEYGKRRITGDRHKASLKGIEKLIARSQPDCLVLQDVNNTKGTYRVDRIKKLHQAIVKFAKEHKLPVKILSGWEVRAALLGNEKGTKYELAEFLAGRFPDELSSRLPPKRKAWMNADARMDIFDAVGLAVAVSIPGGGVVEGR